MLHRSQLTIRAAADLIVSHTSFAGRLVSERRSIVKLQADEVGDTGIPMSAVIGAGVAVAALASWLMRQAENPELTRDAEDQITPLSKAKDWLGAMADKVSKAVVPSKPAPAPTQGSPEARRLDAQVKPGVAPGNVTQYLNEAARTVGVEPALLFAIAAVESDFKTSAFNPGTKATGLFQFLPSTWATQIKAHPELGFTQADIRDPRKNAIMGAIFIKETRDTLRRRLGRDVSAGEVYIGHFMGAAGGYRFIKAYEEEPDAVAATLFPKPAFYNKTIYYNKGNVNDPLSMRQVYSILTGKTDRAIARLTYPTPTVSPVAITTATPAPSSTSTETVARKTSVVNPVAETETAATTSQVGATKPARAKDAPQYVKVNKTLIAVH